MVCDTESMMESYNRKKNNTTLGTFSQMTADLLINFHAETEFLETPDGNFIQVFFLPAAKRF